VRRIASVVGVVILALAATAGAVEVVPVGPSFRIGGHFDYYSGIFGDGYARDPRIAATSDGGFVVVWSEITRREIHFGAGINGHRLGADGHPLGSEFQVFFHDDDSAYLFWPSVAADPRGGFNVVWGEDSNRSGHVWVQRHEPDGTPRGPRFQANESEPDVGFTQARNEVAVGPSGSFLVTWESAAGNDVFARLYDPDGVPEGHEFQVNGSTTMFGAAYAGLACDGAGNFLVAWDGRQGTGPVSVWGRRIDSTGAFLGGDFPVLSRNSDEDPVRVTAGPTNFIVAIPQLARVFGADGVPASPEIATGSDYTGVAADRDGNFIVAWAGDGYGAFGQRYDPTGQPTSAVFQMSDGPVDGISFNNPSIAFDANGDFVSVWATAYEANDPPYPVTQGIFGRRLAVCGDGRLGPLACDDGNSDGFDGCGPRCEVDTCFTCAGEPSACTPIPGCTAACSTAATVDDRAVLTVKKILPPAGDEAITFRGSIVDPPLAPGAYDPSVDGAEIALTGAGVLYQRAAPGAVPPGLVGTGCGPLDGWKVSGRSPSRSFTYRNLTNALPPACLAGSANGLRVLKLKDRLARDHTLQVQLTVKNATLPPVPGPPVVMTFVLGQSPAAGQAGRCARMTFANGTISGSTARYAP
jgi:hypothetical protein